YIGIGSASKVTEPLQFAQTAKKNALDDLTSEISVTVKSESFLNTMQVNNYVQEEFSSVIATYSEEQIEDFEVIDVWENQNEYWIFYRLSKSQHEERKLAKKRQALSSAADFYLKGKTAENNGNLSVATDLMFRGLFELAAYWNEVNEFDLQGTKVFLDNEIFSHLRQMINQTELKLTPDQIELNSSNQFQKNVMASLSLDGKPISNALLEYQYDNGKYKKLQNARTDAQGYVSLPIRNANVQNHSNQLRVMLDLSDMVPKDLDPALMNPLVASLRAPEVFASISTQLPIIMMVSQESNLDGEENLHWISGAIQEQLTEDGFSFTSQINSADYVIYVNASTTKGGTSQGFHVSYLNMSIVVNDKNDNLIYKSSKNDIKGLQLNFNSAGIEAYKKGAKQAKKDIARDINEAIF
ncbi:MAG: LPP20 family lipoprotein, partial [Flavobacteriales bacterium]